MTHLYHVCHVKRGYTTVVSTSHINSITLPDYTFCTYIRGDSRKVVRRELKPTVCMGTTPLTYLYVDRVHYVTHAYCTVILWISFHSIYTQYWITEQSLKRVDHAHLLLHAHANARIYIQMYFCAGKYETLRYFWRLSLKARGCSSPLSPPPDMPRYIRPIFTQDRND